MINLSKYRKDKGLRQKDIVEKLKVDQSRVSKYESGKDATEFMTNLILENYPDAIGYIMKENEYHDLNPTPNITHIPPAAETLLINDYSREVLDDEVEAWKLPGFKGDGMSFVVSGDAMLDTLRHGEIIVTTKDPVKSDNEIIDGFIYVIETRDNILIRRIKKHEDPTLIWLISDNKDYKPIEVKMSDIKRMYIARRHVSFNMSHKVKYAD